MSVEERPADDDAALDLVFDRAMALVEDGERVDVDELATGHEHLRARIEQTVRLAQSLGFGRRHAAPVIAGYEILSELGAGGMGAVYLARQERLGGRPVALKVLPPAIALSARARSRFLAEARAIAKVRHPHVVAIHDVVEDGDTVAYAMEWIDGRSLAEIIEPADGGGERGGPLDVDEVCRLGAAIARALDAVHAAGLVHRDVKPSNLLIRHDGVPFLSDFGLVRDEEWSRRTQAGQFVGTIAYAAPEQLRGDRGIDAATDIYSLGATLFQALTGRPPLPARDAAQMLRLVEAGPGAALRRSRPRLPRDVQTIVGKAMDPQPARRYATAADLADDLERALRREPIRGRRASVVTRTVRLAQRNRAALAGTIAGSLVVLAIAVAAGVAALWLPRQIELNVRDARIALLDPASEDRLRAVVLGRPNVDPRGFSRERLGAALAQYARRVPRRLYDRDIRLEIAVIELALDGSPPGAPLRQTPLTLEYAETLRTRVAPPLIDADRLAAAGRADVRSLGLLAFLTGDAATTLAVWPALDRLAVADPLVDAALGQIHLVGEEHARAYPRLDDARRAFGGVWFLSMNTAEAALGLGDVELAGALLAEARRLAGPSFDDNWITVRLRAGYAAATGHDEEAEALYEHLRLTRGAPTARHHHGRFLLSHGRPEEATHVLGELVAIYPQRPGYRRSFVEAADAWWGASSAAERIALIAGADRGEYFLEVLRTYAEGEIAGDSPAPPPESSASNPETLTLGELAARMEVLDVLRWRRKLGSSHAAPKEREPIRLNTIYRIVEIPDLAAGWISDVKAIAEDGYVVGRSEGAERSGDGVAIAWEEGRPMRPLDPHWRGMYSFAVDVNRSRTVAGGFGRPGRPAVFSHGGAIDLPRAGYDGGKALAINDRGRVAGVLQRKIGVEHSDRDAVCWPPDRTGGYSTILKLPALGGAFPFGHARAINASGVVVGECRAPEEARAVRWDPAEGGYAPAVELPWPGGSSFAFDINASGDIVGFAYASSGVDERHAVLWRGGEVVDLGTFGGRVARAVHIDDTGVVAGSAEAGGVWWPFIWIDGEGRVIRDFIQGADAWIEIDLRARNEAGQIAAVGRAEDGTHGLLLVPCPPADRDVHDVDDVDDISSPGRFEFSR